MREYWKFGNSYIIHTDEKSIYKFLESISGASNITKYFRNGNLVAKDYLIPEKRIDFLLKKYSFTKLF